MVEALEERVAELLGTQAAAFFPSGTMAQQVALRCWAARTGNPLVAIDAGIGRLGAVVMSATTFAGSAQFAAASILQDGGGAAAAIVAAVSSTPATCR